MVGANFFIPAWFAAMCALWAGSMAGEYGYLAGFAGILLGFVGGFIFGAVYHCVFDCLDSATRERFPKLNIVVAIVYVALMAVIGWAIFKSHLSELKRSRPASGVMTQPMTFAGETINKSFRSTLGLLSFRDPHAAAIDERNHLGRACSAIQLR